MKRTFWMRANRQDLSPTKTPTAIDVAWAAGIYEGEGHIRLCGQKKRGLALAVSQKDPQILYRLRDWFGGNVAAPSGGNPCFHWNACGDNARLFIARVYVYLSDRRKAQAQATGCFEFLEGKSPEGLAIEDLLSCLDSYYEKKSENTWNGPNKSAIRRANYKSKKVVAIA